MIRKSGNRFSARIVLKPWRRRSWRRLRIRANAVADERDNRWQFRSTPDRGHGRPRRAWRLPAEVSVPARDPARLSGPADLVDRDPSDLDGERTGAVRHRADRSRHRSRRTDRPEPRGEAAAAAIAAVRHGVRRTHAHPKRAAGPRAADLQRLLRLPARLRVVRQASAGPLDAAARRRRAHAQPGRRGAGPAGRLAGNAGRLARRPRAGGAAPAGGGRATSGSRSAAGSRARTGRSTAMSRWRRGWPRPAACRCS